jgi:winged helix DNA-binding protein
VYDEYFSSYRDHALIGGEEISARLRAFGNALTGVIVMDGMAVGTWKRTIVKDEAHVRLEPFRKLAPDARHEVRDAAERYARFHGLTAVIT